MSASTWVKRFIHHQKSEWQSPNLDLCSLTESTEGGALGYLMSSLPAEALSWGHETRERPSSFQSPSKVAIAWLSLCRQNTTTHLLAGAADRPHSSAEHPPRNWKTILTLTSDIITRDRVFQRANQMHWSWGLFQWNSSCVMVLFLGHKEFN